ncbi:TIGR04086 family membrane protein [Martelella alba]|uniref:CAP-Gly protein n=1 Tax=Martelella alba TaxID=2590451 RepID=A0ABY2SP38_9HYPH|nr:TIGR04086 family membrane protein [Martelella alba]TKI06323.1 CAP-Gly protein [Martelella alba]
METHTLAATPRITAWGAIIGGVFTVLAISILLSVLGTALGLAIVDPTAGQSTQGVGTAVTIWSFVSVLISLAAGGFVAGRLAGAAGISHGFLVWATSLLVAIVLSGMIVGGALRAAGNAIGAIASATGGAASGIASSLTAPNGGMRDWLDEAGRQWSRDAQLPPDQTPKAIMDALRNSNIDALQPDYLSKQIHAASEDMRRTFRAILDNPDNSDAEMAHLSDRLKQRVDHLSAAIKRDDVHNALSRNTSMNADEVERATDALMRDKQRMAAEAKNRLEDMEQNINTLRDEAQQWQEQAKQKAAAAAKAIAKSALWSFVALLIGAVVSAFCGLWGVRATHRHRF